MVSHSGSDVPSLWISTQAADRLLAGSGHTVESLRQQVIELPDDGVLDVPIERNPEMAVQSTLVPKFLVKNVIGLLPGSLSFDRCEDCLGRQLIVVMAQYDSPPPVAGMENIQAANDNASGVAVMLEAIRILNQTEYTPYKSFLFVAYSGEGLDGGEVVREPDVTRFLQARPSFSNFRLEAIIKLRGLAAGTGDRLEVSAQGSLRLAEMLQRSAGQVGVRSSRADEDINLGLIYSQGAPRAPGSTTQAPTVQLGWQGWQELSYLPVDTLQNISVENIRAAGRSLAMALMVLGRETEY